MTEWCHGGSLHSLLVKAFGGEEDPDALTYGNALKFALHIASGVDHLHRHNVLHLDLKPANVLVRDGGKVQLSCSLLSLGFQNRAPLFVTQLFYAFGWLLNRSPVQ